MSEKEKKTKEKKEKKTEINVLSLTLSVQRSGQGKKSTQLIVLRVFKCIFE